MEFVGRKVKISLDDDTFYDGYVHSIDQGIGKITLEKVICTDEDGEKTKLLGLQHLFRSEISDISVAEEVTKSRSNKVEGADRKKYRDKCIMKPKINPTHLDKLGALNPSLLTLKNINSQDGMNSSGNEEAVSSGPDEDTIVHPEYTVIGSLNSMYYDAIHYISKQMIIGVAMEGVSLGRDGKLCWVQVAVPDTVIVFDILKLGKDAFEEGLQDILEAENILKVFHDCRMVSDIMYHQYGIKLINVFDTQVASAMVYRIHHQYDWPRHVHGLASCLIEHLDILESQVNWAIVRDGLRESDEEVWMERPVKKKLLEAMVKNVIHLLDLRHVLVEKMMDEFVAGVNIYLSHVRDASNGDIQKYQKMSHLLPSAFQDIRHFMRSCSSRRQHERMSERDCNGFRENYSPIKHPNLIFSHDSLWHNVQKKGRIGDRKEGDTEMGNEPKKLQRYAQQVSHFMPTSDKRETKPVSPKSPNNIPTTTSHSLQNTPDPSHNTDLSNDGRFISPVLPVTHGRQSASNTHLTPNLSDYLGSHPGSMPVEGMENHSVSSIMRTLIQEQAPPGSEDHADIDEMNFMPAGKVVKEYDMRRSSSGAQTRPLLQPVVYQSGQEMFRPGSKQLTKQEIELVNRISKHSENKHRYQHLDQVLNSQGRPGNRNENSTPQGSSNLPHFPMKRSPESNNDPRLPFTAPHSNHDSSPTRFQCSDGSPLAQFRTTKSPNQCALSENESLSVSPMKPKTNPSPLGSGRLQALRNAMNSAQ